MSNMDMLAFWTFFAGLITGGSIASIVIAAIFANNRCEEEDEEDEYNK